MIHCTVACFGRMSDHACEIQPTLKFKQTLVQKRLYTVNEKVKKSQMDNKIKPGVAAKFTMLYVTNYCIVF